MIPLLNRNLNRLPAGKGQLPTIFSNKCWPVINLGHADQQIDVVELLLDFNEFHRVCANAEPQLLMSMTKYPTAASAATTQPVQPNHAGKFGELSSSNLCGANHRSKKLMTKPTTTSVPKMTLAVCTVP